MADDTTVEFCIKNLSRNPDAVLVKGFFEHDAETVTRLHAGEWNFALENARDNARHASGNADGNERTVQSTPLNDMARKNGLLDSQRLFDKLVFKLLCRRIFKKQMNDRRVRRKAENLSCAICVFGDMKFLPYT